MTKIGYWVGDTREWLRENFLECFWEYVLLGLLAVFMLLIVAIACIVAVMGVVEFVRRFGTSALLFAGLGVCVALVVLMAIGRGLLKLLDRLNL